MEPQPRVIENGAKGCFATTRWSVILASKSSRPEAEKSQEALAQLCKIYWQPIYAFIRRKGSTREDAKDLAQDFFLKVLEPGFIEKADQARGKFRALLLSSLENFLRDRATRSRAQKRGGGILPISLDDWTDESACTAMDSNWSPERVFDTRWAFTLSENSLAKLRDECVRKGRERVFTVLSPFLSAQAETGDYQRAEQALGLQADYLRVLVSRLRERYRALLRAEVGETVSDEKIIGEELLYLYSLLIGGRGGHP